VECVPSLTVIALFGGIRRVDSGVLAVSGTVPIPVASEPADEDPDEDEDDDPLVEELDELEEPEDDPVELADWVCCSSLWIAAVSALLVRVNASWLYILARPLDKLVIAELIVVITASLF
jgi:hypothetical protein